MENFVEEDFDLARARELYRNGDKIQILLATCVKNNRQYVIKRLKVNNLQEANTLLKESYYMMGINHSSIIKIHAGLLGGNSGSFDYIIFVMDYYPDGDLAKEIQKRQQSQSFWPPSELQNIFKELASGFGFMQDRLIAHRDIKPQNILRAGDKYVISDLGCAFKTYDGKSFEIAGTPNYLSPLLRSAYITYHQGGRVENFDHDAFKSDMFSLGLTFLFMASLKNIDELGILDEGNYKNLLSYRLAELKYDETIKTMIGKMLEFKENERFDFLKLCAFCGIEKDQKSFIQEKNQPHEIEKPQQIKGPLPPPNTAPARSNNPKKNNINQGNVPQKKLDPSPNLDQHYNNPVMSKGLNPPRPFGVMEMIPESHQKAKIFLRDIQQDTGNCNAFKVFNEPNKMNFRWVVKIPHAAFFANIENRIRNIMLKPDFDAILLLRYLSQAFKIKVNIQSLHYKCKICSGFQDGSFLPCSCQGYVHNQCLGSQLSFSLPQNVVFYGYFCNSCQSYHTFNYKELVLCSNCQNLTLSKAGSDFCLRCLSNQDSANDVIRIYKTLSSLCNENYSNITGLCSSCSGIPDVFMMGGHWSCYNCIFGAMIFDGFIQCQGKCCFMKLIPIEIQPIPIMKPDFGPMIEENKDRTNFQVFGKLNSIKEENKSRAPPVTGFQNNSKVTSMSVHADTNTILPMPDKLKGKGITKYCSDCCAKEKNPNEIVFSCCGKFRCSMCKLESHPGKSCADNNRMDNIKCPFCRVQLIPIDSSKVRLNCKGCKGSPKCLICLVTHSSFTNCEKLLQEIHY